MQYRSRPHYQKQGSIGRYHNRDDVDSEHNRQKHVAMKKYRLEPEWEDVGFKPNMISWAGRHR
jgi:hypothetical protein